MSAVCRAADDEAMEAVVNGERLLDFAVAGIDLNMDGKANMFYVGRDRNYNAVPDAVDGVAGNRVVNNAAYNEYQAILNGSIPWVSQSGGLVRPPGRSAPLPPQPTQMFNSRSRQPPRTPSRGRPTASSSSGSTYSNGVIRRSQTPIVSSTGISTNASAFPGASSITMSVPSSIQSPMSRSGTPMVTRPMSTNADALQLGSAAFTGAPMVSAPFIPYGGSLIGGSTIPPPLTFGGSMSVGVSASKTMSAIPAPFINGGSAYGGSILATPQGGYVSKFSSSGALPPATSVTMSSKRRTSSIPC